MLEDKDAATMIAVKDMARAKSFYEGTLGLKQHMAMGDDLVLYQAGRSMVAIYPSEFAGSNKATYVSFNVGNDIDSLVRDLKAKGVAFEHYNNLPGLTLEGDLHVGEGMKAAWFKDPDGNILNLASM